MSATEISESTRDSIRSFIFQQFPIAQEKQLRDDDSLLHDGLIDSMDTLDVVMFLEEAFQIELDDEDLVMDNFATINSLAEFVHTRIA